MSEIITPLVVSLSNHMSRVGDHQSLLTSELKKARLRQSKSMDVIITVAEMVKARERAQRPLGLLPA